MPAAVVNPNILSVVFIKAPAPRKPMPVTIAPKRGSGLSGEIIFATIDNPQAPTDTKIKVPNPIGLCDLCLSNPKAKANKKVIENLTIISIVSKVTKGNVIGYINLTW